MAKKMSGNLRTGEMAGKAKGPKSVNLKGAGPRPGDRPTSMAKGQSKIGAPGTNLEPVATKPYVKATSAPKYKGVDRGTKASNPPTDKAMITSAHRAAAATGIEPRYGGNCGRKMDICDDAGLMRAARANSTKAK